MPGEKKKKIGHEQLMPREDGSTDSEGRDDVRAWVEMNGFGEKDAGKKGKGKRKLKGRGSVEIPVIGGGLVSESIAMSSNDDSFASHQGGYINGANVSYSLNQDTSFDIDDSGPHREMPIDVPPDFIATIKSPPRYPPRNLMMSAFGSATSPSRVNKVSSGEKPLQAKLPTTGVKSSSIQQQQQQQPTAQELERLHRHQEALKKRREEERRLQAEEEFLRASLRGSKKLQALKSSGPALPAGLVNTGYDEDDNEDDGIDGSEGKSPSRRVSMIEEPYLKKNVDVEDLFSTFHHIRNQLNSPEDQKYIFFVRSLFQNEQFQHAVSLHCRLVELTSRSPPIKPVSDEAERTLSEIQRSASRSHNNSQVQDLLYVFNKPHFKSLFWAHDAVSQQSLRSTEYVEIQEEPLDYPLVQYGEDSVKIIHIEKTNEHLGATVKNEGESVIIGRIVKGGVAEKSGLLQEGDEILEVNGINMRSRNINDVSEILASMSGTITFMIIPGHNPPAENRQKSNKVMHLRALFSYEPEDDLYIPCRELGINFVKGDILHAIALDDPNWWQAFREGEEDHSLAGLIPSKSFTEKREALKNALENKENKKKSRVCACGKKDHRNKRKKKPMNSASSEDYEEIPTYEELARYYPQPNRKRPIVLIGPSNIGRNELQQRLLDSDPDRFGTPVPHTTCPLGSGEEQDRMYHHIPREEFNMMIQQNKFVEYGDHQKNLYGTSFDSVRNIIIQGKVCLLKMQPENLKVIRASDLKPYIIFVCPPNLEKLRQLQNQLDTPVVSGLRKGKEVLTVDDQLRDIIDCSREIEETYGHLFDFVLVNNDLNQAFVELLNEINRIEMEPQWVPASWISNK